LPAISASEHSPDERRTGPLAVWHRTPLYLRVVAALILGVAAGLTLGIRIVPAIEVSSLILRMLTALATPLILVAVVHALAHARIEGRVGLRLLGLLLVNTLVAIAVGLLVANLLQPGRWGGTLSGAAESAGRVDFWQVISESFPRSLIEPLLAGEWPQKDGPTVKIRSNVLQVIVVALAFGLAFRKVRQHQIQEGKSGYQVIESAIETVFGCFMVVLHWVIDLVPIAVFCVVASKVGKEGLRPFLSLAGLVVAVIAALLIQACYYLLRVRLGSWVTPKRLLQGCSDALLMAFSTASSTATMPVTFARLKERVGLREESASLGALVGSNFNNDGTALYEAMAALFIAQSLGIHLDFGQQLLVVLTSIFASVGAAGIPEAGLVTMTLVFSAVNLPTEYILTLLTVDWFLDRCRTTINVMGDMTVSCLLDGRKQAKPEEEPPAGFLEPETDP
jgi:Na+/H+-dicarboxylate symporter